MGLYINGEWVSHALCEVSLSMPGKGIKKYRGVTAINYSDELKRTLQYGTGPDPLGSAVGPYEPNADAEFLKNEAARLFDDLGDNYGLILVSFQVAYRPLSSNGKLIVDKVPSCNITKVEDSSAQGDQGNKTKVNLLPNEILSRNGKRIIVPRSNILAIR